MRRVKISEINPKKRVSPFRISIGAFMVLAIMSMSLIPDQHSGSITIPLARNEKWYRGNTHTHATFSDDKNENDVPEIAGWYKELGYSFLLLSEHNDHVVKKQVFCHDEVPESSDFIMICGLELSKKRHQTAFGIDKYIGDEVSLQDGVKKTTEAGGVPILNHPQDPVVRVKDFLATEGLNHLEVFNGNRPEDTPATAPNGRRVYAVATDDNHYKKANAGRGWIMVKSAVLTKDSIKKNLKNGNFYASTGIVIADYKASKNSITIASESGSEIKFIGQNGRILTTVRGLKATYKLKGTEKYVRVKVTNDAGKMAWMQPVFID
jgi:predicted RNA-binding protein YlqC (UPF0109 family)